MPKVIINNNEVTVNDGLTIIQACEQIGVEIPRFCYHERLAIAGNCRMCLVEVEKFPKPVASCSQVVNEGMVIHTDSAMVKKAREGVMEFLLINHPLDCPICDQGGECDLQDQAMKYGKGRSRYFEEKRAVAEKEFGPLIKTNMTRCIHCTRCVRFLEEVAGTYELGAIGRGENMEISTYIENSITSELSGNIIDLCPVGALTSKPYAFQARSWELQHTHSIDVLDAVGSNIRIDSRRGEVMRILPRVNESINEEWISDKTRFSYDGLKYQRLDSPMVKKNDLLETTSWQEAYSAVVEILKKTKPDKVGVIAGNLTDVETMMVTKKLMKQIGSDNYDCRQDSSVLTNECRESYIFNTTIAGIERSDSCLIIGSNIRHEAAIVNAKIRKAVVDNQMKVWLLGPEIKLNYPYQYLGNSLEALRILAEEESEYSNSLKAAKYPMLILGAKALTNVDANIILDYSLHIANRFSMIREDWNGFNILQYAASRVGGLDIGFIPPKKSNIIENSEVLFLLGADEIDIKSIPDSTFVIYIGHHGDRSAYRANVILPGAAYTEKEATYVNLEGRVQRTNVAVSPPNQAKQDWIIINELAMSLGYNLNYSSIEDVRAEMQEAWKGFKILNVTNQARDNNSLIELSHKAFNRKKEHFFNKTLDINSENFYLDNTISRFSRTMSLCSKELS